MAIRPKLQITFLPSVHQPCTKSAIPIVAKMVRDALYPREAQSKHDALTILNVQFDSMCAQAEQALTNICAEDTLSKK